MIASPDDFATSLLSELREKVVCSALSMGNTYWFNGSISWATPPVKATGFSLWLKMPFDVEVKGSKRLRE